MQGFTQKWISKIKTIFYSIYAMWQTFMDMDKFGGEEDRQSYTGLEGVNAGPLHPIYYIVPLLLLLIVGLI